LIALSIIGLVFVVAINLLKQKSANESDTQKVSSTQIEVPARFVGGKVCAGCHQEEYKLWSGSHHDLAMQVASEKTVLGDFNDKEFTYYGLKSRFNRR